jgi:Protein of unknown function (DUF1566)
VKRISRVIVGVIAATALFWANGQAQAQTTANGPYYATPAWDQTLPNSTRFILLSNMNSEAFLDRETGVVWERGATPSSDWFHAAQACYNKTVGNRKGWRPATVEELSGLFTTTFDGTFPPFGTVFSFMWTSTTVAGDTSKAWVVTGGNVESHDKTECCGAGVWCVRAGHGHDGQ